MKCKMESTNNRSFTFVETLVVISVLGLVLPILFTIFFVILQQQLKILRITEVKRIGDNIVQVLENTIKNNAYTIYDGPTEICEADNANPFPHSGTPSSFRDKYKSTFSIDYTSPDLSVIYPAPVAPAPTFAFPQGQLNNSKVNVSSYSISCNKASIFSAPLISINFTVCYSIGGICDSTNPQEAASLDYQSNIKLRSFPTQ